MRLPKLHAGLSLSMVLAVAVGAGCAGTGEHSRIWSDFTEAQGWTAKTIIHVGRITSPPPGKALVNFHRPSSGLFDFPPEEPFVQRSIAIFDGSGQMLIYLPEFCLFQYVCDPGEQIFMVWGRGKATVSSLVKADLAPDQIYDIIVDGGRSGLGRKDNSLTPITKADPKRTELAKFETQEKWTIDLSASTPRVAEFEAQKRDQIDQVKKDLLGDTKSDRVMFLRPEDCR